MKGQPAAETQVLLVEAKVHAANASRLAVVFLKPCQTSGPRAFNFNNLTQNTNFYLLHYSQTLSATVAELHRDHLASVFSSIK